MIMIYMRPKKSPHYLTLQGTGKSWKEAVDHLRVNGLAAFTGEIEPRIVDATDDEIVQITLADGTARIILRSLGLSA